jgi:DNA segregation ATPase FtsK/SpoIIIE, S-DNA-T family
MRLKDMRPQVSRASNSVSFVSTQMQKSKFQFTIRSIVLRFSEMLVGLLLIVLGIAAVVALATWSVADPSLSHATGNIVSNALGKFGAIVADLLMQFLGLATVPALVPTFIVGYFLALGRPISHKMRRVGAWVVGTLLMGAFLGCFNAPISWPLPVGIGGVLGDILLKIPGRLSPTGYPTGMFAALTGLILMVAASWCFTYTCNFVGFTVLEKNPVTSEPVEQVSEDADEETESHTFGALIHYWLSIKGFIARRVLHKNRSSSPQYGKAPLTAHMFEPDQRVHDDIFEDEPTVWVRREPEFAPQLTVEDDCEYSESLTARASPMARPHVETEIVLPKSHVLKEANLSTMRTPHHSSIMNSDYEKPPLHLLGKPKIVAKDHTLSKEALQNNARMLEGVLDDFGVRGEIIAVRPGPVVTLYELEPAPGIKSSRVIGLADDIARSMSAIAARVAVVPGRNAIGIELPNLLRETVYLRELVASQDYENSKAKLALALGKTINGEAVIADLAKMPHVLVAGTTGSGKSVAMNTMILSLLYRLTPQECRLIMIDPKMLELSVYDGIPHLLTPVVTDPKKAVVALKWTVKEMEDRYRKMSKVGVRNIDGFNQRVAQAQASGEQVSRTIQTGFDRHTGEPVYETEMMQLTHMPYIVVLIDEMADLMMVAGKEIEGTVQRLAQMARAAGIHVIMATQRPSVDVITGTIKANFPTRISFQVTSKIDSRTILGEMGAEQLLGQGDMLYMAGGGRIQRVHGPFVSDDEVEKIVAHLKLQGAPQYLETITQDDEEEGDDAQGPSGTSNLAESDDPYDQAVSIVLRDKKASTSYIQRRMGIGYNRAASLIERMEKEGIVGPSNQTGKREILVPTEDELV